MEKDKEKDALDDLTGLGKPEFTIEDGKQKITGVTLNTANRRRQGVITSLGATPESSKLKLKMFSKEPAKDKTKEKLPDHIRKVYITINDKKKNEPVLVQFSGEWTGSDINMAGKYLILEYNVFVRNRAIRSK